MNEADERVGQVCPEQKSAKPRPVPARLFGVAGGVPVELKAAARSGRLQNAEVHDRLPLGAEFHGVAASDHAHVFDEVEDILKLARGLVGGAAKLCSRR